jgi:hypothetical protein
MNTPASTLIKCPESGEYLLPEKIWASRLPNGTAIQYGQFGRHHHQSVECPWSFLIVPLDNNPD